MTLASRQLTDFRRLQQARAASLELPVSHDKPQAEPQILRQGVARIVEVQDAGKYLVTEQAWDAQADNGAGAWIDAIGGYTRKTARDFRCRPSGREDAIVPFWEQYAKPDDQGGLLEVLIDIGDTSAFWAQIDQCQVDGSTGSNRWIYAWTEICKVSPGYSGWAAPANGRSGGLSDHPAYNSIEKINTGQPGHIEGIGVDPEHLVTDNYSFQMQPCPAGCIVRMHEVPFSYEDQEIVEYWFAYENGVDGECL